MQPKYAISINITNMACNFPSFTAVQCTFSVICADRHQATVALWHYKSLVRQLLRFCRVLLEFCQEIHLLIFLFVSRPLYPLGLCGRAEQTERVEHNLTVSKVTKVYGP